MKFHIVALKTLKDLFSIKRTMIFLIVSMLCVYVPTAAFKAGGPQGSPLQFDKMTLAMQTQMFAGIFTIFSFILLAGIPLVFFCFLTCADFICGEKESGTLLLLVSKPIRRYEIVIGKFLAFFLNAVLLESILLLASPLMISYEFSTDPLILDFLAGLIPQVLLYSIFVILIFGSISTALSALFDNKIKVIVGLVALVLFIYFGFTIIRGYAIPYGIYEKYKLYAFDVNYHLGNVYFLFLEQAKDYRLAPEFQAALGQFTGTYETTTGMANLFDRDLMALPPTLKLKGYVNPVVSMLLWLFASAILFSIGLLKFERKEIH